MMRTIDVQVLEYKKIIMKKAYVFLVHKVDHLEYI